MERLLLALHREGAEGLPGRGGRAAFRVPWSVTYGPLWAITRGEFVLEGSEAGHDLRYHLSLHRGCLTIAASVLLWIGFELLWMGPTPGVAAFRGLVVWLCLWSAGYLWVAWRFARFLRRVLASGSGAAP